MWADKAHILLQSPYTWGIIALILAAIAFSGRLSVNVSNILLIIALLIGCFGIFRSGQGIHLSIIFCLLLGIGLTLISWWIQPSSQPKKVDNITSQPMTQTQAEQSKLPTPKETSGQPKQPTAQEIAREVVEELGKREQKALINEFPEGFVIFGLMKPGESLIPGFVPHWVKVDWKTGGVTSISQDVVSFDLPDIIIKHNGATTKFNKCKVILPRQAGYIFKLVRMKDLGFQVKVLSESNPVIIALGFVKESKINNE